MYNLPIYKPKNEVVSIHFKVSRFSYKNNELLKLKH